jgi:hypothetical protein
MKTKNMTTLLLRNSVNRAPLWRGFLLIVLTLASFALSPTARAVLPPPDGGYANLNTAEGDDALFSLTTGSYNTAIGFQALYFNTTGVGNMANGAQALYFNTTGDGNTATGGEALLSNTTGSFNTATGSVALISNTTGNENTATGEGALASNTTGSGNTANGLSALLVNTTGDANTANGFSALLVNTSGNFNTANGLNALYFNTTGSSNIAIGSQAGANLTTGNDNIDIGNVGIAGEAKTIRIGTQGTQAKTFIAGISGAALGPGMAVRVNSSGQLGTAPSSARFKQNIKPMDKASEAILALKPVTFHYKKEFDPEDVPQFGLVAEEVEKVNPALVGRDADGKVYTVRYDAVNAMLLNEFLKEHRSVEELKKEIAALTATVKEQAAQIQKVSAPLDVSKTAPQIVLNNQ